MDERHVAASVFDLLDAHLSDSHGDWFVCDKTGNEEEHKAEVVMVDRSDRFSMEIDGETFVFTVTKEGD